MKAAQIKEYGGIEKIVLQEMTEPLPKEGQILVRVKAASLNPFDGYLRNGGMKAMLSIKLPFTLGGDFAGVVTQLGEGVKQFSVGDEVYGSANVANGGSGSLAEQVAANAANTGQKPTNVDWIQAAALPLTGVSALQAIDEHIKLAKGQKILIQGGAGGIGSHAIQIAKARGAYVAVTVAKDSMEFVQSLGADLSIDYKKDDFTKLIHDYDAVFDTVGGTVTAQSMSVIRAGGVLVTMSGQVDEAAAGEKNITAIHQGTKVSTERLDKLRELVESGLVKPQIDKIFSLDEAREAYKLLEQGHPKGKVVVKLG